jgi:ABC-type dipeptide/oligopeptide/nickel transport system permease component
MIRAIISRAGQALLGLFALTFLLFAMVRMTGDPAYFLTGPDATEEMRQQVRVELGLDKPLPVQYVTYIGNLLTGDLGNSFRFRVPVSDLIMQRLPATLIMGGAAVLVILLVAVPLGIYSAYWRGGIIDKIGTVIASLGQAIPSFWVGIMLILVFAVNLRLLPSGGYGGFRNLIMPTITLALEPIARLTRLLRSSVLEELGSDYVTFHRMKGMPERTVLWKHVLRNAGMTSLTFVGIMTVGLLTGSVLVETVFVWPGIGRLLVEGIEFRDFNIVQGVTVLITAAFILVNFLVDILYMVLNPRLRMPAPA